MRWTPGGRSEDVEDRRGESGGRGFGGMPRLGLGGIILLLVLSVVFKRDLLTPFLGGGGADAPTTTEAPDSNPAEEPLVQFVSFVLDDAQATWAKILQAQGVTYQHAKLVLFRDAINSACGFAQVATGPFYCPLDRKVYIDLGFYQELKDRFGAPGDFAQAYVLAHEIGHHVQNHLGIDERVRRAQREILDRGDVEEGLRAAAAVGDDRIQRMSAGRVNPDAFTHGTSAQRVGWFKRGYESGQPQACDIFNSRH